MSEGEEVVDPRLFFQLSPRTRVLPVVHGSADFALAVRDEMLRGDYDCLAVPLPESFREALLEGTRRLPQVGIACQ